MTNPEVAMCKLLGKHKLKKISRFKLVCSSCGCEFVDEEEIQILISEVNHLQNENSNLRSRIDELEHAKRIIDSYPKDPLSEVNRYKEIQRELERFITDRKPIDELDKLKKIIKINKRTPYYEDFWY